MSVAPKVLFQTSLGNITLELNQELAPISVENFLSYVDSGYYEDTIFHRVIKNFMIQCGGMNSDMEETSGKQPIKNEATNGLKNICGSIAMARTQIVDSATSQFFINLNDNEFLDHRDTRAEAFGYAVFGKVVDGMDVVKQIELVATGNKGQHQDVPVEPVVITSVSRIED
ncbi:MAG: peptidyl-prolyl cis-trans isomerase A [Desulfuromonadales bacterium C00003068]|jgi:peptidyl-prolyl cis-trans isomerase B (cyclophilin B)|nr:MAG: peptidyl-prolyl cis-trans isomerase A [Desulfuromonadales bacterium C00003068]